MSGANAVTKIRLRLLGRASRAFTVVELLSVLAIIGLLAAILIPSVASARSAADKARTRVQFSQWTAAISAFRTEYGYYPLFHASNLVNGGADDENHLFHDVLAGRKRDGSVLTAGSSAAMQNRKLTCFLEFSEADFSSGSTPRNLLRDAFGTTEIAILVDRNLDGMINSSDFGATLPMVGGIRPDATEFPSTGIRAGCLFYCAMPGATAAAPQFILSWK
jgi:prepilin-type N-terminal cleavage/methylation domain-containing protein